LKIIYADNDDEKIKVLNSLTNFSFDLIHLSQLYPERSYLFNYFNWIGEKSNQSNIKFIIDDVDVYPINYKEIFINNNPNCLIVKEDKSLGNYPNIYLEIKKNKKYFLIYNDNTGKYDCDIKKLSDSVKKYSDFEVIIYQKKDIDSPFVDKNKAILSQTRGGGYWLWKPYIINKTLKLLNEGDLLFYMDSSYYFYENFKDLYKYKLKDDILIWKNKPNEESYFLKNWCKMDVIYNYNMYHSTFIENYEICWAGALLLKKSSKTEEIIDKWLKICCIENNITDIKSIRSNNSDFIDHRHDQSLLSVLLHQYNIPLNHFEKKFLQNKRYPY